MNAASRNSDSGGGSGSKKTKLSFKEKFELENMEASILTLETELTQLQAESELPETISNHKRLGEILSRMAVLQSQVEQKYQRWTDLEIRK